MSEKPVSPPGTSIAPAPEAVPSPHRRVEEPGLIPSSPDGHLPADEPVPFSPDNIVPHNIIDICAGDPVPDGWIKVNDHWDPIRCGDPTSDVSNVWTIYRLSAVPTGGVLAVCADAATPSGWVVIGTAWDPLRCGRPTTNVDNVKTITRG